MNNHKIPFMKKLFIAFFILTLLPYSSVVLSQNKKELHASVLRLKSD